MLESGAAGTNEFYVDCVVEGEVRARARELLRVLPVGISRKGLVVRAAEGEAAEGQA